MIFFGVKMLVLPLKIVPFLLFSETTRLISIVSKPILIVVVVVINVVFVKKS